MFALEIMPRVFFISFMCAFRQKLVLMSKVDAAITAQIEESKVG